MARVDELECAGHGDCALAAPGVFEVDDVARVIGTASADVLIEAAESCPAGAISVFDEESGAQLYP